MVLPVGRAAPRTFAPGGKNPRAATGHARLKGNTYLILSDLMTRVNHNPIYRSNGHRSRSPGRLTPWPKIGHIFGTVRPDPHHSHASWSPSWKLWVGVQVTLAGGGILLWPHLTPHSLLYIIIILFIIERQHAFHADRDSVYQFRPSVSLSVRPSNVGIVSNRMHYIVTIFWLSTRNIILLRESKNRTLDCCP